MFTYHLCELRSPWRRRGATLCVSSHWIFLKHLISEYFNDCLLSTLLKAVVLWICKFNISYTWLVLDGQSTIYFKGRFIKYAPSNYVRLLLWTYGSYNEHNRFINRRVSEYGFYLHAGSSCITTEASCLVIEASCLVIEASCLVVKCGKVTTYSLEN